MDFGSIANAFGSAASFGKGVVGGVWDGAKGLAEGVYDLGAMGVHAVGAGYKAVTDSEYRNQLYNHASELAHSASDFGARAWNDPKGTASDVYERSSQLVGAARKAFAEAHEKAIKEGREAEFFGSIIGRGGFEIGSVLVPVTKLGAAGKLASAGEKAEELAKVAKAGQEAEKLVAAARAAEAARMAELARAAEAAKAAEAAELARAAEAAKAAEAGQAADKSVKAAKAAAKALPDLKIASITECPVTVAEKLGLRETQAQKIMKVAKEKDVEILLRPGNEESLRWIAEGHPPKPEGIKFKTINAQDVALGAAEDQGGLVGCFKPDFKKLKEAEKRLSPEDFKKLKDRFRQREKEYEQYLKYKAKPDWNQKYFVKDGLVYPNDGKGLAFTGDVDVYEILDAKTHTPLRGQPYDEVVEALTSDPDTRVLHGAHRAWRPANADGKAIKSVIDTKSVEQEMFSVSPKGFGTRMGW